MNLFEPILVAKPSKYVTPRKNTVGAVRSLFPNSKIKISENTYFLFLFHLSRITSGGDPHYFFSRALLPKDLELDPILEHGRINFGDMDHLLLETNAFAFLFDIKEIDVLLFDGKPMSYDEYHKTTENWSKRE